MNNIIEYKELTYIETFDWDIITVRLDLETIWKIANDSSKFIKIWDRLINKNKISQIYKKKVDELEQFILEQSKDIQIKLREKKNRLKKELWKEMTLNYAKNFIKEL